MKILLPLIFFGIFSGLVVFQTGDSLKVDTVSVSSSPKPAQKATTQAAFSDVNGHYDITVQFLPAEKKITVHENLLWINKSPFSTKQFFLHLYLNAYKSNRTIYARGNEIPEASRTSLNLKSLFINHKPAEVQYVNTDEINMFDSTVGRINLAKELHPRDTLHLEAKYEFVIPKASGRIGYTPGEDLYCISQWFIKPGVFKDGKWICSPFFPYTEFFADFANYYVTIEAPSEYQIASSGTVMSQQSGSGNKNIVSLTQTRVHDFVWTASRNFKKVTFFQKNGDGKSTEIVLLVPKSFESFIPRYKSTLTKCFSYFEKEFETYPYRTFTMVVTPPKSGMIGSMEYPALVTISHKLLSPESSFEPEKTIIHEFAHQYFYGILANNEVYEAWLDEGFANYITDRLLESSNKMPQSYFKLFNQIPVSGLEILSLGEIPLIYSLTKVPTPLYAKSLIAYYNNMTAGSLADSSYLLNDEANYFVISYSKGEIFLKTLEELVGAHSMDTILKEYYKQNKYTHPTANDFFKVCSQISPKKLDWFINDYYSQSLICDYKIHKIYKNHGAGTWTVEIKREGEGRFPLRLDLYTDKDTLIKTVFLTQRYTSVQFKTNNNVVGAEIDPKRKNIFDINFANNSYFIENQYGSSLYLSVRWFYWVQSFLLIFGGIA